MNIYLVAGGPLLSRWTWCMAFALLLEVSPSAGAWDVQPVGRGVAARVRTDSAGAPHIAVFDDGFRYLTLDSENWEERRVFEFADDFALDKNDGVFFLDTPRPDFFPTLQVHLSNGLTLGTEIAEHRVGEFEFLGFDKDNRPHVAYNNTSTQQLIHSRWTGESWNPRVVATDPQFRFGNPDFVSFLDSSDQAHFAWRNDADLLRYASPISSGWVTTTPFPALDARVVDLAIDGDGVAHLAYDVFTGSVFTGGLHYANNASNGDWQGDRIPKTNTFGVTRASLVIDNQGRPNLFDYESPFSGPVDLVHYLLNDDQWEPTIIDTHSDPQSSGPDQIDAAFDGNALHVLFSTGDRDVFYAIEEPENFPGDYNNDGSVDAADYTVWRDNLGSPDESVISFNGDGGDVGQGDFVLWRSNYGATLASASSGLATVPEPSSVLIVTLGLAAIGLGITRNRRIPN